MVKDQSHKTNLVFMGPPGVGKGTVASIIAENKNYVHLSTGNIFRDEIASKSELGLKIANIVSSGKYVSDEITNEIVKKRLEQLHKENKIALLDGYPRTTSQAQFLDSLKFFKYQVIELVAPEDLIMKRLNGRRSCPECKKVFHVEFMKSAKGDYCDNCNTKLIMRKDDSVDSIKTRMNVYKEQTKPLLSYYREMNNILDFDATGKAEKIVKKILNKVYK